MDLNSSFTIFCQPMDSIEFITDYMTNLRTGLLLKKNGLVGIKDPEGIYIATNISLMQACGLTKKNQILGKNDNDLIWKKLGYSTHITNEDKIIADNNYLVKFGYYKYYDKTRFILKHKYPIYENKKLIGYYFQMFEIHPPIICNLLFTIKFILGNNLNENIISIIKINLIKARLIPDFSSQEEKCLFYMFKGYTSEETAKKIFLSRRTVEDYLNSARQKLGASSKLEIMLKFRYLESLMICNLQ